MDGVPQLPDDILEALGREGDGVLTKEQEARASKAIRNATREIRRRIAKEKRNEVPRDATQAGTGTAAGS